MTKIVDSPVTYPFRQGTAAAIYGQSRSGKSNLLMNIVRKCDQLFDVPPVRIDIYSALNSEQFEELTVDARVHIFDYFPDQITNSSKEHLLVIIDDGACDMNQPQIDLLHRLCTGVCHHFCVSLIITLQVLFYPKLRSVRINVEHHIYFPCNNDRSSILLLAHKLYPHKWQKFLELFAEATSQPYTHLMYTSAAFVPDRYRLQSHISDTARVLYDF